MARTRDQSRTGASKKTRKTSRLRKPAHMSIEEWQIALRREFGRAQNFRIENIGGESVFSEFLVTNPETAGTYRVAIRGQHPGDNYCSCPDFAVNTLGICKHIEFALAKLERKRGAKKAFREGFHPPYSEVCLRYGVSREVCFRPGTECPEKLIEHAARFFDANGVLKPDAYSRFHTFLKKAPRNGHELRCYEDAIQFVACLRDDARRRSLIEKTFSTKTRLAGLINADLYPYQCTGALFAAISGRCLLADDMGLGKTVQAVAAVEILDRSIGIERVLIISPTSLKYQWKHEIERFTDRTADVVEGLLAKRSEAYETDSFYKITNYDVIHTDSDLIERWAPDVVVLDEAQRIKNWKTRTARSVKRLRSRYAIVLTGTPLENRIEELHSIVEFVDRFRLGPLFRFLAAHQQVDENGRVVGYHNLSGIGKTLEPILVRRTKKEVLDELPERVDKHFFLPMTDEQWKHHVENKALVGELVAKWRRRGFLTELEQRRLMMALQNMRMVCNSTYLLDQRTDFGAKADELISVLDDVLQEPDAKVVVFSQWVRTHELILRRLESQQWGHVFFHGSVPSRKRKDLIQQFKQDPACRLFLSTDAGGVGLNLQNASVVVNMDQPWNPAVLEQRVGRVHRLGQRRNVRVIHFVAQGTIEHGMLNVLEFKKSVFSGVLDGGEDEVFFGKSKLKKFMETVDNVTSSIPAAMPAQQTVAQADDVVADDTALAEEKVSGRRPSGPGQEVWNELMVVGMAFIGKLGQALQSTAEGTDRSETGAPAHELIAKDSRTGESFVKLPVPGPETLKQFAGLLNTLADAMKDRPAAKDDTDHR
jgi:superfamily II DNA or RNA helicase